MAKTIQRWTEPSPEISRNAKPISVTSILETDKARKLNPMTANLLELVRVLENIEVTSERIEQNQWAGVTNDGERFMY